MNPSETLRVTLRRRYRTEFPLHRSSAQEADSVRAASRPDSKNLVIAQADLVVVTLACYVTNLPDFTEKLSAARAREEAEAKCENGSAAEWTKGRRRKRWRRVEKGGRGKEIKMERGTRMVVLIRRENKVRTARGRNRPLRRDFRRLAPLELSSSASTVGQNSGCCKEKN